MAKSGDLASPHLRAGLSCSAAARLDLWEELEMGDFDRHSFLSRRDRGRIEKMEVPLADGVTLPIVKMAKEV